MAEALPATKDEAQRKGLDLSLTVPPDLRVKADRTLTVAVLRNLVGNAVKYTDAGTVQVTPRVDDRYRAVALRVGTKLQGLPTAWQ